MWVIVVYDLVSGEIDEIVGLYQTGTAADKAAEAVIRKRTGYGYFCKELSASDGWNAS
jgi:hypothetical protein